jgi:hypothetical protein
MSARRVTREDAAHPHLRRPLMVALTLGWLALALGVVLGADQTLAAPAGPGGIAVGHTPLLPAPSGPPLSTNTPTSTATSTSSPTPTATPATSPTATPTRGPTATPTVAPTDTPVPSNGNGGGGGGGGGSGGSGGGGSGGTQPTRVVLSQPTIGAGGAGGIGDFSPADMSSNGLFIFSTLGCVVGILGLIAAAITWVLLVSEGWGPLLKAVLLGNRKGRRRFRRREQTDSERRPVDERYPAPAARGRSGWR